MHQRRGDRHCAGDVDRAARPLALALAGQKRQAEREDRDPDRDVDEEDPVPAERVGEHAAEQDADAAAAGHHEAEEAHRLRPLDGLLEEQQQQRERDRRDDRAAEALHRTRGDQHVLRGREPTGERGDGEERDPAQEDPPVPEQVAEPSAQQQEAAEGQQVRVQDPRERLLGEAEVGANRGQRDVHDRRVEHDHQVPQAEDVERQPACSSVEFHRSLNLL